MDNHTNRAHNMYTFPRDTEHDMEQSINIPGYVEDYLLVNGSDRPWYAKKGPYILSAVFGVSWYTRKMFMENTSYAQFTLDKTINL